MKYTVVSSPNLDTLINWVNEYLNDGWKIQGGISAVESRSGGFTTSFFAQAMFKED